MDGRFVKWHWFLCLFLSYIFFPLGCTIQSNLQLYHRKLEIYQKEVSVDYQVSHENDSSYLYVKSNLENYRIICRGYERYEAEQVLFERQVEIENVSKGSVQKIALNTQAPTYACELLIYEVFNLSTPLFHDITFVNSAQENRQSIHFTDEQKVPLLRKYLFVNEPFKILYKKPVAQKFYIKYTKQAFRPAPPPFSAIYNLHNPLREYTNLYVVEAGQTLQFSQEGSYFVQTDTSSKQGVFINCLSEDYPKPTRLKDLIVTMRYITRNNEYERMMEAKNKKRELDNYWLVRANNNKNAARYLLKTYFKRIEQANKYFTSYKEGWKTDRGLIFVVFGKPQSVRKYLDKEIWYYSSKYRRPPIEFVFTRIEEQYILNRNEDYRSAWRLEIQNWRKGYTQYIYN